MSLKTQLGSFRRFISYSGCFGSRRKPRFKKWSHVGPQALEHRILLSSTPIASEVRLNTTTQLPQVSDSRANQTVEGLPTGGFISVWESLQQDGSGWGVFGQRLDAAGNRVGTEFQVNQRTRFNQRAPSVHVAADGRIVVAWQSLHRDGSVNAVIARIYNANGTAATEEFIVNQTNKGIQGNADVGFLNNGNFVVTWNGRGNGDKFGVFARVFNASGSAVTNEFNVSEDTKGLQFDPTVAGDSTGGFWVAWSGRSVGDRTAISARRFAADGTVLGGQFQVNEYSKHKQDRPAIAASEDGRVLIGWQSQRQDGSALGVYARLYNADGSAGGDEFRVNETTRRLQYRPHLDFTSDGGFAVTWMGRGSGDRWGVFLREYNANGVAETGERLVNVTTKGLQFRPSIAVTTTGFVVMWSGRGQGDRRGVFASVYREQPDTLFDLSPISNQIIDEGQLLTVTPSLLAGSSTANTFSVVGSLPSGATLNTSTGRIEWTPGEVQGPGSFSVTLTAQGSSGQSDSETFTITVNEVPTAPVLAAIGAKTIDEGQQLTFTASATDQDLPANALRFRLGTNAPAGAAIDAVTGVFTWTPTEQQGPGSNEVTFIVEDGTGQSDSETIVITVNEVNLPPVLAAIADRDATEGTPITFTATASDPDIPLNTLTFSLVGTIPDGATINATSGQFIWTPSETQGPDTYPITVQVSDGVGGTDQKTFSVNVTEASPQAPVLSSIGNLAIDEQTLLTFTAMATDATQPTDTLTYTLENGPPTASIDPVTGNFTWTPSEADGPGNFNTRIVVTDSTGLSDSEAITITVREVNVEPILGAIGNRSAMPDEPITFTATATDSDTPGNSLTFSIDTGAPAGATINPSTGLLVWTPPVGAEGTTVQMTVRVTDNGSPALSDSETVMITVGDCAFDENLTGFTVTQAGGRGPGQGTVIAEDCTAVLTEGNSFVVTLEKTFDIPATPSGLELRLENPVFDVSAAGLIRDAFEIAVVDVDGNSLVQPHIPGRDAVFNITEGLPASFPADGVTVSGDTITIGLNGIPAGTAARVIVRLVNNDTDTTSTVRIKDLQVISTSGQAAFSAGPSPVSFSAAADSSAIISASDTPQTIHSNLVLVANELPASQALNSPQPITLVAISTSFNAPVGIDYHEPTNSIVVTANYPSGQPLNFERIEANGEHIPFSDAAGFGDEVKIATVRSGVATTFVPGDLFVGNGIDGEIVRITDNGNSVINPWVSLPGDGNGLLRGSLHHDRTGVFGGDLLAVTTGGEFWRITSDGTPVLLADVDNHLEGLAVVPNDPDRYGPLAGKAIAGAEHSGQLFAVDVAGVVSSFQLTVAVEDIDIVPPNENFFGVAFSLGQILGAPAQSFTDMVGDILLTQELDSGSGLYRLLWDGTALTTVPVELTPDSIVAGQWEHVTFAPAGIVEVPPVTAPPVISVQSPFTTAPAGTSVILSGLATAYTPPGSQSLNQIELVTANGQAVHVLDATGRFWLSTELMAGANNFEFQAVDSNGRTATASVTLFGTQPTPNEIDFSRFADITGSFSGAYFRTSFNESAKLLNVNLATKNDGPFATDVPLLVGVKNISDPGVSVVGASGLTPERIPYYDYSQRVPGGRLQPGQLTESPAVTFHNPNRVQFTYDLVFYGKLNEAPIITTLPDIEALSGRDYVYDVNATDADLDTLRYSLATAPSGMTIDANTGVISWTPASTQLGLHNVAVHVSDVRGGSAEQRYTVSVIAALPNRPPVITSQPVTIAHVTSVGTDLAPAFDPGQLFVSSWGTGEVRIYDPETLAFIRSFSHPLLTHDGGSVAGEGPRGMAFNSRGNLVVATNQYFVEFSGYGVEYARYEKPVAEPSENIVFDRDGNLYTTTFTGGSDSLNQYRAADYALVRTIPLPVGAGSLTGLTFDSSGRLYVGSQDDGRIHVLQANADFSDFTPLQSIPASLGGFGVEGIQINVNGELVAAGGDIVRIDAQTGLQLARFDAAIDEFPVPLTIDNSGRIFTGDFEDGLGSLSADLIRFSPDGSSFITVNDPGLFGPFGFVIAGIQLPGGPSRNGYRYDTNAIDPDDDVLEYSFPGAAPDGMSIDRLSGLILWSPTADQVGNHTVKVLVEDGRGGVAEQEFIVCVHGDPGNHAPVIVTDPSTELLSENYLYDVDAVDPDADTLTYTLRVSPPGMTIDQTTGRIDWTPPLNTVGPVPVTVRVTDGRGGIDEQSFALNISEPGSGEIRGTIFVDADDNGQYAPSRLLVVDGTGNVILAYDPQTAEFRKLFVADPQLLSPVSAIYGPDGHLYVAGFDSSNIVRFDGNSGAFLDVFVADVSFPAFAYLWPGR
jgi:hypothetical protein